MLPSRRRPPKARPARHCSNCQSNPKSAAILANSAARQPQTVGGGSACIRSGPARGGRIHCYGARAHRLCPMSRRSWGKVTRRTQEPQTSWRFRQGGGSSAATRSNSSTRRAATPATSHAWGPQPIEPETPRKPAIPAPGLAPAIRQRDSACPPCRYGAHPSWPGCLARLRPCLKAVPCGRQARYADSAALATRCARRLARRWR
jgi:hypothetical protein